jgi:hypothetical protein
MGSDMMWRESDYERAMTKLYAENKAQKETIESLRAAVRAADAMADAVSKLGGIADMPWSREYVALQEYREVRAKCGEVT